MNYDTANRLDILIFHGASSSDSKVGNHVKCHIFIFIIYGLHHNFWKVSLFLICFFM